MRTPVKVSLVIVVVLVAGLLAFLLLDDDEPVAADPTPGAADSQLVREDSHVIGEEGSTGVTFVEFLDFECEACLAAFPAVEQLRQAYAGQVTFVVRYFPIESHFNAERAARAVEAASRQGAFEEMYVKMYETQTTWSEQQEPKDDVFRGFAEELGLDVAQWESDYSSSDVLERIQRDRDDGIALGVQGTPTFFVDGERLEPQSYEDLANALDSAIVNADQ